jgi:hypothetical protein
VKNRHEDSPWTKDKQTKKFIDAGLEDASSSDATKALKDFMRALEDI